MKFIISFLDEDTKRCSHDALLEPSLELLVFRFEIETSVLDSLAFYKTYTKGTY